MHSPQQSYDNPEYHVDEQEEHQQDPQTPHVYSYHQEQYSEPAPEPQQEVHHETPAFQGPLIQTESLIKQYSGRNVVNGVNIHVEAGQVVGLLGPNGAGKTTTFYMIVGLVQPTAGRVVFNGEDVTSMPMYRRARLGVGYLPQEESIFRKLTTEENLMAILEMRNLPSQDKTEKMSRLLAELGLTGLGKQIAATLSERYSGADVTSRNTVGTPSFT